MTNLCAYSDLAPSQCAHCRGDVLTDLEPTPAATNPTPGRVVWSPSKARHDAQNAISRPLNASVDPNATHVVSGAHSGKECRCGRPVHNNATICEHCADQLARALGSVDALAEELDTTITKQRSIPTEGTSRAATCSCAIDDPACPHALIPWHDKAADAKRHLHGILVSWVRLCSEEVVRHQSRNNDLPADNLPSLSTWLLWRVDGLARHDAGHDAVDQITAAVAQCIRLIDRRPDREFVGPCECGRDLYRKPKAPVVKCRGCGNTYDAQQMLDWMSDQVMGRYVTAREGAGLLSKFGLPIKQGTIDKWHERGLLQGRGHDLEGRRRTYLLDDLMALAARNDKRGA